MLAPEVQVLLPVRRQGRAARPRARCAVRRTGRRLVGGGVEHALGRALRVDCGADVRHGGGRGRHDGGSSVLHAYEPDLYPKPAPAAAAHELHGGPPFLFATVEYGKGQVLFLCHVVDPSS